MAIVAGFDVHRAQITFDALDTDSGEVMRGRIDATPDAVTSWIGRFAGQQLDVAVEACTGWLFVSSNSRVSLGRGTAHRFVAIATAELRDRASTS